jgi:hypothetical protein
MPKEEAEDVWFNAGDISAHQQFFSSIWTFSFSLLYSLYSDNIKCRHTAMVETRKSKTIFQEIFDLNRAYLSRKIKIKIACITRLIFNQNASDPNEEIRRNSKKCTQKVKEINSMS